MRAWFGKKQEKRWCLFVFSDRYLALMVVRLSPSAHIEVEQSGFFSLATESWQSAFLAFIEKHSLRDLPVYWVLQPQQYQLVHIDHIPVPETELKQAALWRVAELLDLPVTDLAIEVFPVPPHGPGGQRKLLTVVVTERSFLNSVAAVCQKCGLSIQIIDISELVLKRLHDVLLPKDAMASLLMLHPFACQLLVTEGSQLYFSRLLDVDYDHWDPMRVDTPETEQMLLEIQRSYDYYVSQFSRLIPPLMAVSLSENNLFVKRLQEVFAEEVIVMDWAKIFPLMELSQDPRSELLLLRTACLRLQR